MKITIECSENELSCMINDLICSKPKSSNLGAADTAPMNSTSEKDRELLRKELERLSDESQFMGCNRDLLADYALAMCELYRTLNLNVSANNQTPTSQSGRTFGDLKKDFQRFLDSYGTPCGEEAKPNNLYEVVQQFIHKTENEKNSQLPKTAAIDNGEEFSTTVKS